MDSKTSLERVNFIIQTIFEKCVDSKVQLLKAIDYLLKRDGQRVNPILNGKIQMEMISDCIVRAIQSLRASIVMLKDFLNLIHQYMNSYDSLTAEMQYISFRHTIIKAIQRNFFSQHARLRIRRSNVIDLIEKCGLVGEYQRLKKRKLSTHTSSHNFLL